MSLLNDEFYRKTLRPDRQKSYKMIVRYILKSIKPDIKSVVDYGCGAGWFLYYFKKYGIEDLVGIDPNKKLLTALDKSLKENIRFMDLTKRIYLGRKFDLAINVEVLEHINGGCEDISIENITRHSDLLIFSAATLGQGGWGHVNEQPFEFWEEKLNSVGFSCDWEATNNFRTFLKAKKAKKWYVRNISVFKRK